MTLKLKKKIGFMVAVLMTAATIALAWSYTITHRNECNTGLSIGYVLGSGHSGSYYVKNLRIYNRILSQHEINDL